MKFRPRGDWLAVWVHGEKPPKFSSTGGNLCVTGFWFPVSHMFQGTVVSMGDFEPDYNHLLRIDVGSRVLCFRDEVQPVFADGDETIRLVRMDDIIAHVTETTEE